MVSIPFNHTDLACSNVPFQWGEWTVCNEGPQCRQRERIAVGTEKALYRSCSGGTGIQI